MKRTLRKTWVCNDVWMDIFPLFDRPQLGLKLALTSPRFDALVDKHFDGKSELTVRKAICIQEDSDTEVPKLSVFVNFANSVDFPLPERPLPHKIRFKDLQIEYIEHSVLTFLRSNKHIWDGGIQMDLRMCAVRPIWGVFAREIWPIFATNIRDLVIEYGDLDKLRRYISPTIFTDLNTITTIHSGGLTPEVIADDGPNATVGQALSKWLHTPTTDGQPKRLYCSNHNGLRMKEWESKLSKAFACATATSSASFEVHFNVYAPTTQIVPFELVNERTKEKLTLEQKSTARGNCWLLKRCPIIVGGTASVQRQRKDENLDSVLFYLSAASCIW